jgi:signal transduction histidine kinase
MPEDNSPADAVLQALGYALFRRDSSGGLRPIGKVPAWLKTLWPEVGSSELPLDTSVSPFLENFLVDAEECWRAGGEQRAASGPWVDQDNEGNSVQLEATALTVGSQPFLLLERLGEAFEVKKSMLQKARENVIAYQRLNSETQKKEILLHCVADEMSAALANIVTALRLLEMESSSPRSRELLSLASRATSEQQALIHKVLAVFADELSELFGQDGEGTNESDLFGVIEKAIAVIAPQAEEKNVRLTSTAEPAGAPRVPLDPRHLELVIDNLIENALDHTSSGGEIVIRLDDEDETVVVAFEDDGVAVAPEAVDELFSKLEPGIPAAHAPALRLHFCRMLMTDCGGEFGGGPRDNGGNRFWIRLPKIAK